MFFLADLIDIFLTLSVLHLELEALFSEYIQLKICELCFGKFSFSALFSPFGLFFLEIAAHWSVELDYMNWMRNRVKLTKKNQLIYYLELILNMVQLG